MFEDFLIALMYGLANNVRFGKNNCQLTWPHIEQNNNYWEGNIKY
jgi:hypothetical protein